MILFVSFDLLMDEESDSRKDTRRLRRFLRERINKFNLVAILILPDRRPLHRVRLSRASLPVSKEANIHAIECCLHKRFYLLEYLGLTRVRREHLIKAEEVPHFRCACHIFLLLV